MENMPIYFTNNTSVNLDKTVYARVICPVICYFIRFSRKFPKHRPIRTVLLLFPGISILNLENLIVGNYLFLFL